MRLSFRSLAHALAGAVLLATHAPRLAAQTAAQTTAQTTAQPVIGGAAAGRLVTAMVPAPALVGNLLGDPAEQRVDVYLPPSYDRDSTRRYPVVYLLHGFLGSPDDFTTPTFQGMTVQGAMDTLARAGRVREMIVVVPNGRNRYGGSFYVNSPVTGNWADYVTRDVVAWVDRTYRTAAAPASRGVAGHSMGGYAALVLGTQHPELFGAVYAMSPCCVDVPPEYGPDNPMWEKARHARHVDELWAMVRAGDPLPLHAVAALAAWSPAPDRAPFFVDWPTVRGRTFDTAFVARWRRRLPAGMADDRLAPLRALRGLGLDVGTTDQYSHIPPTTRALSARLSALGVPHAFELYDGDHRNRLGRRMSTTVLPFFGEHLRFPDGAPAPLAGSVRQSPPAATDTGVARGRRDAPTRYLFYLPPRNVELLGVDSVARLTTRNRVDLRGIVRHFEEEGFAVVSRVRTVVSPSESADSTVADVRAVLDAGVPADRVTLVGHGKGGTVALLAAAKLGLPALNVVALAPCTREMLQGMSSRPEARRLAGRILVLRTANDGDTESCRPLFARVGAPSSAIEVTLPDGEGSVEFSLPRASWVGTVARWARGDRP